MKTWGSEYNIRPMSVSPTTVLQSELSRKIKDRSAVVSVVGLGYVGLPLAIRFAEAKFRVVGIDTDPRKVELLNAGKSYINHIPSQNIAAAVQHRFQATTDFAVAAEADAIIICVPTPLTRNHQPDLSHLTDTLESLEPYLHKGQIFSLQSTTYPGTTEELVVPLMKKNGFVVGEDVFVIFSPEREDPGNIHFSTENTPKICSGITPACLEFGMVLYQSIVKEVVAVTSTRVAEMVKLLENIYRAVNIGLVNEMKMVADKMNIDIREVIRAAATKPFGFVPFDPGPGVGGHCIPVDPFYLTWKAKEYGVHTRFIELAGEVNNAMPDWVVGKVAWALNQKLKPLKGSRVLILGLGYKKNVDDVRESPSIEIMQLLHDSGAQVSYSDPFVSRFPKMRRYNFDLTSRELTAKELESYDCVVLATAHDQVDYAQVLRHAKLIVDTRGVYRETSPKVIRA